MAASGIVTPAPPEALPLVVSPPAGVVSDGGGAGVVGVVVGSGGVVEGVVVDGCGVAAGTAPWPGRTGDGAGG